MRSRLFAQFTLPEHDNSDYNKHVSILDNCRVRIAQNTFAFDHVFVPMALESMFLESRLARDITMPVLIGQDTAVVYYGEDAAGKQCEEFMYQCGKALFTTPQDVQLTAYGFYKDHRVPLFTSTIIARSPGGIHELLEEAAPMHRHLSRAFRGRSHAVFRFEAVGSITIFLIDGLPNELRQPNHDFRLTTLADNLVSTADRPDLPKRLLQTIISDLGSQAPVFVVVHCPLAAEHRYALADSLRFASEWRKQESEMAIESTIIEDILPSF